MKILVFLALILCACNSYHLSGKEKKEIRSNPPGTVHLRDNLYIDRYEISNVGYREFLSWIERNSVYKNSLEKFLPDTFVWNDQGLPVLTEYYHDHPGFNNYPAVGISYEQAVEFCKWRSDRVNELLEKRKHPSFKFKKVRYRLPTRKEWELAGSNGLDLVQFPFGMKELYDKKNRLLIYSNSYKLSKMKDSMAIFTANTRSLYPSSFGLYHMAGNLSEMIIEKGISKGGNYNLPLDSCKIKIDHNYTKPEAWLGFRCVCEIIE